MNSELQDYLLHGGSLQELNEKYSIRISRSREHPNLVHFKYLHNGCDFSLGFIRECRGTILDEADGFRPVARPFDKFFNFGDARAPEIDWSSVDVQEKLDGSLCYMYFYKGEWHVGTTGTADGFGKVHSSDLTFKQLFFSILEKNGSVPHKHDECATIMFELMSPHNTIVIQHDESKVCMIGLRVTDTGQWHDPHESFWSGNKPPVVRSVRLHSYEQITDSFSDTNGMQLEGYVVVDSNWNRVKIKHPGYVMAHQEVFMLDEAKIIDKILTGEVSEIISSYPDLQGRFDNVETKLSRLESEIDSEYDKVRSIEQQKDFAMAVKDSRYRAFLFEMRKRNTGSRDVMRKMASWKILDLCGGGSGGRDQLQQQHGEVLR